MNSDNFQIDLILDKKIIGDNSNISYAIANFSEKINKIYQICLPIDYCYLGKSENVLFKITTLLKKPLGWIGGYRIKKLIRDGNYDFVYLNELILHPLITHDSCFIIHVRVIFDCSNESAYRSLEEAKGVIFIDHATFEPFEKRNLKNKIILNNPFQMARIFDESKDHLKTEFDWKNKTVFSIIGRVVAIKGISFVIESFTKAASEKCLLIIVGPFHDPEYLSYCRRLAEGDDRIIFYGSEEKIQIIYDISDYIIRGDPLQCIGRTIYEGLYSGCDVIVPGTNPDIFFEYEKFKEKVHFYQPNNNLSLTQQIERLSGRKVTERHYYSNVQEYLKEFNKFIDRACQKKGSS